MLVSCLGAGVWKVRPGEKPEQISAKGTAGIRWHEGELVAGEPNGDCDMIAVYRAAREPVRKFKCALKSSLHGVAVHEGKVWWMETDHDRVVCEDGTMIELGSDVYHPNDFCWFEGDLFYCHHGKHGSASCGRVVKHGHGPVSPGMNRPHNVVFDGERNLWTCDSGSGWVRKNGMPVHEVDGCFTRGLMIDPDGEGNWVGHSHHRKTSWGSCAAVANIDTGEVIEILGAKEVYEIIPENG